MKKILNSIQFLALIILFIVPAQHVYSQLDTVKAQEIYDLADESQYKKAIKICDDLIADDPTIIDGYIYKSELLVNLEKYEDALLVLDKGIEVNPDEAWLYNQRGMLLSSFQLVDEALIEYSLGLKCAKNDTVRNSIWLNQAGAKSRLRDFEGAYEILQKCYAFDSTDIKTLNNLATVCDEVGKPELTEFYLLEVIKIDSLFIGSYVNLGFMYQGRGEYEKSITYFDQALGIKPDEPFSYSNRSYSKLKIGDLKGALEDVNRSLELYPGNAYAYRNRALIYIEMGKKKKACEDIETALKWDFTKMYGREVVLLQREHCE